MDKNINVSTRFYQPGDEESIIELLKKTFPKWAEFDDPIGLWKWKYIETPLKHIIVVVTADDKIVGCEHAVIFNGKFGFEITTLGYSDDLAVDTDYRGLGIWKKIRIQKKEKFCALAEFVYSTTINPIVQQSWVKRNLNELPFPVTRMVKTHDIDLQLVERPMKNKFLTKLGYYGLKALNTITNIFKSPVKSRNDFEITKINEFDEGIDSFWDKIKDDYNFILEKKHPYLNWRFTDNDRGNHVIFQAVNGDEVLGYVVAGFKEGYVEGQVEDLIALKDREDVVDALLDTACNCLDELGVNTVYYQVVEGHPYQELSRRKGFIDSRSRPNIMFDYSANWIGGARKSEIPFLNQTVPGQVYFNYATTI